jgi:hypothetical protein
MAQFAVGRDDAAGRRGGGATCHQSESAHGRQGEEFFARYLIFHFILISVLVALAKFMEVVNSTTGGHRWKSKMSHRKEHKEHGEKNLSASAVVFSVFFEVSL